MSSILLKINALIGEKQTALFFRNFAKKLKARTHYFTGSVNIEWVQIGSADKPALLFLHGFADRKENFYFCAKHLQRNFQLIIPDMPGFGCSSSDRHLQYTLENYENWICEFIEGIGLSQLHLAGNSLGGAVAAKLAVKIPDKIQTLSLIDPAGFYIPGYPSIYDEAMKGDNLFQTTSKQEFESFRKRIFHAPPALPVFVESFMLQKAIKLQNWFNKIFLDLCEFKTDTTCDTKQLEKLSLNRLCSRFSIPVNIFWGKKDTLFPWQTAEYLNRQIEKSQLFLFDNTGHCPHLEKPAKFAAALVQGTLST